MEYVHQPDTFAFEYNTSVETQDFASIGFMNEVQFNSFLALVVKIIFFEEKWTNDGREPFLVVSAVDMYGTALPELRLWHFDSNDIITGALYIIRGLEVVPSETYNYDTGRYEKRGDGSKALRCNFRTAMEDVSHITQILSFF